MKTRFHMEFVQTYEAWEVCDLKKYWTRWPSNTHGIQIKID